MRSFTTTFITVAAVVAASLPLACDEPSPMDVEATGSSSTDAATVDSESTDDGIDRDARGDVLARAWLHAFRRHLEGYPGGASPLEQRFAAALAGEDLSDVDLREFIANAEAALMDVPEGEVDDLSIDEPLTEELLAGLLPPLDLATAVPEPLTGECPDIPPFNTNAKYRAVFEGFTPLALPPDGEWPWYGGEEVYLTWSLFTPTARWSGRTGVVESVNHGIKKKFTSGYSAPSSTGTISADSLLMFRVFEKDGDAFYNSSLTAAKAAAATAATMINWNTLAAGGSLSSDAKAVYDTLSKSGSANDDVFEVETVYFSEKRLWQVTSGCVIYPESSYPFGVPSGDYYKYAMRQITSNARWLNWVSFKRL